MKDSRTVSLLYVMAFILALAMRFIQLEALPLSDGEAEWALQAHRVSQGMRPLVGSQPIYIFSTSLLFYLFGATNFLARFLSALSGSLVVFVPFLFQKRIKSVPSLLLAFFLALDPGMVSLSRQAGSLMPALAFILLAWAFWWKGYPRAAGIFAGLALLSGPSVWLGLLGLGLAWIFRRVLDGSYSNSGIEESGKATDTNQGMTRAPREDIKAAAQFGAMTVVLGGTLFLLSPNGLSAWLNSLPEYLGGWVQPSGVPMSRLLFALVVYQPLALLFGLVAVVRGWQQGLQDHIQLSLWLVPTSLLVLFYPARQVGDLAWTLVPLWALAALELSSHVNVLPKERREVASVMLLVIILLTFSWLNYAGIALDPASSANSFPNGIQVGGQVLFRELPPTRYVLLISTLLLLLVSIVLVAMGWSSRIARLGSIWGVTITIGVYSIGVAWGATGLRIPAGWELWWSEERPDQAQLLLDTVNNFSEWSTGDKGAQGVTVIGIDSPALAWLFRERELEVVTAPDLLEAPAIVISLDSESYNFPISYRGQDFDWRQEPDWDTLVTNDWIKWSVFRSMPLKAESIVVWVRNDLFPDSAEILQ